MKKNLYLLLCAVFVFGLSYQSGAQQKYITTIAGNSTGGSTGDGGPATAAEISGPAALFVDATGNIFIADGPANRVRKINTSGIITTVAGTGIAAYSGDGAAATLAELNNPSGVTVDDSGNVFIGDTYNQRVRKVSTSGIITTVAGTGAVGFSGDGGPALSAVFDRPYALAFDSHHNLYIVDQLNHEIRELVNTSGIIARFAGIGGTPGYTGDGGPATAAEIQKPNYVITDASDNVFITDNQNQIIRKVNTSGIISTIAGTPGSISFGGDGGPATLASFAYPAGIRFDASGNLYISDYGNNRIRMVNTSGIINTIAGTGIGGYNGDGIAATSADLDNPIDVAFTHSGNLIIADFLNTRIRELLANHTPIFTGGERQTMTVCENSTSDTINSHLAIRDSDVGQTESWTVLARPLNGTIVPADSLLYTTTSTGATISIPSPTFPIFYTPNTGFTGIDSFYILVSDGITSDTTKIVVTVNPAPTAITGTLTICAGSTSTLADAATGGTWSSGSTSVATVGSATGIVTGVLAGGIADIIYTTACGTVVTTVTVNAASPITGSLTACVGTTTLLSDTALGTWSSGSLSIATAGSTTGVITGVNPGTSVITYHITGGCAATAIVTVTAAPAAITGSATTCVGTLDSLHDAITGGTWSSSNIAVATISTTTGILIGVFDGTTTITYTTRSGCAATLVVTVIAAPGPISSAGAPLCAGTTATLTDTTAGGTWTSSNTAVVTVDGTGDVTGVVGGTSVITYGAASCNATTVVTVAPSAPLTPTVSSLCLGSIDTFTEPALTTPYTGVWSNSNSAVATMNLGIVTSVAAGTDLINYTIYDGGVALCLYPATVNVTPGAGAITPTTTVSVCTGATTTLADTVAGGTWTSSNTAKATVSSSGVVTGVSAGTVTITYNTGGCFVTKLVTVISGSSPLTPSSATICTGTTTTLTDVTTGGIWSSTTTSVATVAGGIVHGVASGTSTISYTIGTCAATAVVTVNASPVAITPATAVTVCSSATTTLVESATGGVWGSSNSAVATVSSGGIVSGVAAGSVTISYSVGSCFATKTVSVTAGPAALSISSATICTGTTASVTDATSGGVWSSTATATATVSSTGLVSGVAAGTATISYLSGACAATAVVTVVSSPAAITPSAPVSFCEGSTSPLADAVTGGSWSSGNTAVATVSSAGLVTGVTVGTATISYTAGSCFVTKLITVSPGPASVLPELPVVCTGSTITLTDAVSGGTWSSSATATATVGSTGIVSGVAGGTVNIYYIIGSCVTTSVVTVNAAPATSAIAGTTSMCTASTTTFTDPTTGGTWSSSNTAVASVSPTGVVSGLSNGTATISYSFASSCGVLSATHVITVSATPSAGTITGTTNICAGTVTSLSNTVTGGTWSSSNGNASVNITTGLLTGITPGTATITYKVITSCGSAITTTVVTVGTFISPGAISGTATTLCGNTSIALTETNTGGVWSSSNASATVSSTGIVTGAPAGGTDTISYTTTASCGAVTATYMLTVNPVAVAGSVSGISSICTGTTTTLTDTTSGGVWSASNGNAIVAGGVVTPVSAGTDTVFYTVTNGCGAVAAAEIITISATVTAGAISGTGSICPGAPVTLTDAIPGGVWSSSSAIANVSSTGVVSGIAAGTATISYTVSGTCGTDVATFPVTISSSSVLSAGSLVGVSTICIGGFTIFTDAEGGGVWSLSNGNATITSGGVVTGISTGSDVVSYTVSNSCGTASATQVINVSTSTITAGAITGAASVCIGFPVTLTDAIAGGIWSASNTNAVITGAGVVTGITTGLDTIVYSVTNSCGIATATFVISVNSTAPSAGAITGPASVCAGSTMTLGNAVPGGVWSATNVHASVSSAGVVSGVTTGTDTIRYTVSSPCGTASVTKIITIGLASGAGTISGSSTVCVGSSITLTDGLAGGAWSSSNANATVSAGGVVSGISAGAAVISYSVTYACGSVSAIKDITINPSSGIGSITGADSVCQGATITLTDATPGGVWSSGNADARVTGGVVTGVSAGTAPISYSVSSPSCGIISAVSIITIVPNPAAGGGIGPISSLSIVCIGSGITLVDPTPGGVWEASNSHAIVVGAGIIDGVTRGIDTISYVITNGCGSGAATKILNVDTIPVVAPITGAASQCVGTSITLSDATAGGVWTTSNPAVGVVGVSSGSVDGMAAGVTTISYTVTNAFGCPGTVTITDAVTPPTVLTGITGSPSVCAGGAVLLSNPVAGGTWSSTNPATAAVDPATGVVTGVAVGSATIIYTVVNSCGTSSVSITEVVNPLPVVSAISGPSAACMGTSVTFTDAAADGVWSSNDTTIATVDAATGIVTARTAGAAIINYTVSSPSGCSLSVSAPLAVSAAPVVPPIVGTTSECIGSATALSDGTGGGVWSSSNTTIATVDAGGNVTGVTAGSVTISYSITDGTGCTGSAIVIDIASTVPVATPVTGAAHVCAGATATLTNSIPGGVWGSGNPATAIIDPSTGTVTGVSAGTDEIYYSVSNTCGSAFDSASITVYPAPLAGSVTAAYTSVCTGNLVAVSDAVAGGVWVTSNTAIATVGSTGLVTGVSPGIDTIYYVVTNSFGCVSASMVSITVGGAMPGAVVDPIGSVAVCAGHTVFMNVISSGGISYQWLRNLVPVAGATAAGYTTGDIGNYSVIVSNGICSETLTGPSVTTPVLPVVTFTAPDILYTGTFASYKWYRNGVLITGATGSILDETQGGIYTVVVTDANGCSDTSVGYTVLGGAGVNGINAAQSIKVYPNPATSLVHIDAPVKVNVSVLSIDGKVLITAKDATDIDVTPLADGMYMILIYDQNNLLLKTTKFAKTE